MQTTADLNAAADLMKTLYTHVALLTSEGLDGTNIAGGGGAQALTYSAAGAAGPTADHPAIDGIAWSAVVNFTLTEVASHVGLLRGGVVHYTEALEHPVGSGSVPYVHGIGPSAV